MKDRDFLIWLHERLTNVHGEDPLFDYMHKLRAIIAAYPKDKITPNLDPSNNLSQLLEMLRNDAKAESDTLSRDLKTCHDSKAKFGDRIIRLEAENGRLREALKEICEHVFVSEAWGVAKAALRGVDGGKDS